MIDATGYFAIDASEARRIVAERELEGWRIFRLPSYISSKEDFFEGVRCTMPLDPPLQSNRSWEALADSLWAGLDGLPDSKIIIVWPEGSSMETLAPKDYSLAADILGELPGSFGDVEITAGSTKELLILRLI